MKIDKFYIVEADYDFYFLNYLLTSPSVRTLNTVFNMYDVKFVKDMTKKSTVYLKYPKYNIFWFLDLFEHVKKYIVPEKMYIAQWRKLLKALKEHLQEEVSSINIKFDTTSYNEVINFMGKYDLREYQALDTYKLLHKFPNKENLLILSDPRTGKTRTCISYLLETKVEDETIFIVCPKAACIGWAEELELLCSKIKDRRSIKIIEKRRDLLKVKKTDIVILTYSMFKRNSYILERFSSNDFVRLIVDEAHILRHQNTEQSKAIFEAKNINQFIGISGTPAVKDSEDVYGMLCLIGLNGESRFKPSRLFLDMFKEYFYVCEDTSYGKKCKYLRRTTEINYLLQQHSIQTKQSELEWFKDYEKKYTKISLNMDILQKEAYDEVRQFFKFEDIDAPNQLVQFTRLAQICSDPSSLLSSYGLVAPKFKWILKFIEKNPKYNLIIISKSVKVLDSLYNLLYNEKVSCSYIKGSLNNSARQLHKDNFGKTNNILLLQFQCGKEALTLPQADCTIFLDRAFSVGDNEQAEARMTPIDGKKATKYIIDLIMKDSIEEQLYERLIINKISIHTINDVFIKRKEVV